MQMMVICPCVLALLNWQVDGQIPLARTGFTCRTGNLNFGNKKNILEPEEADSG